MTVNPVIARRTALAALTAGVGAVALAACGSSGSSDGAATEAGGSIADSAGSATTATTSTGPSAGSSAGLSSARTSSGAAAVDAIARLGDITVGEAISAKVDGENVLVSRPTATTAACFSAKCTHQGCTVKPAGSTLDCPCHGSVFNALTGAVEAGPAPSPLPSIAVKVVDGSIVKA